MKKLLIVSYSIITVGIISLSFLSLLLSENDKKMDAAQAQRYQYVVSGDAQYEKMYWDILAIRNGEKPRPQEYSRIYWDLVLEYGDKPRPDGETIALQKLMENMGFTEEEFAKLREAQNNSDSLVTTETIAMNAVKGLYDDGSGNYTKKGEPNCEMARRIMHDRKYHQDKAAIMKPIDEFFALMNERTRNTVNYYENRADFFILTIQILVALLAIFSIVIGFIVTRRILKQVGGEPSYIAEIAEQVASGNLALELEEGENGATGIYASIKEMINKLVKIILVIQKTANEVDKTANEIWRGNASLSQRTKEQAVHLEETAANMEEMTNSVQRNADHAEQAAQLATATRKCATRGEAVMNLAADAMNEIDESSQKITDIISVINEIAFKTNLLALNAAVEAARAGEQGRGFAVVALEVRSLAQSTAESAREIKNLIEDSVKKVSEGTKLVDQSGSTLHEIIDSVKKVSDIVSEIADASTEQSSGIHQMNKTIVQLDEMTQQNASLVQKAASASESLNEQARYLKKEIAFFTL